MAKSIMITGASSGLGEGMARHLAERGHRLALCARRRERLDTLAAELAKLPGGEPIVEELDVTDYASVPVVMNRVANKLGRIDIVVANAGIAINTPVGKGNFADVRRTIETNLLGAIATIEAAVEMFRKQGGGHVVGISSVSAARGMRGQGAYSASKAGLSRYLEALRAEVVRENIRVTDLAPGYIDTDLNRSIPNRPFLVSAERGTEIIAGLIEKQVGFRYVPSWPWTLVAQILKILPTKAIAKM
jgi:NAD(P)-dependent dehydrogenase (short-subunit alcohol dehydrogenase family)